MKNEKLKNMRLYLSLFFFMILIGCASSTDIISTEKAKDAKYSNDDVRKVTVDQPFLISGDYFREREQKPSIKLKSLFSKKSSDQPKVYQNHENRIRLLEQQLAQSRSVEFSTPPKPVYQKATQPVSFFPVKVGFIIESKNIDQETLEKINLAISKLSTGYPVFIIDMDEINENISNIDCPDEQDLICLSEAVKVYPGARMTAYIEKFKLPETMSGVINISISVIDTGLSFQYPAIEISDSVKNEADVHAFIAGALKGVFDFIVKKNEIMPWHCRSFSSENENWFITAGRISGLKKGDTLKIVQKGHIVKSPSGLPAGWIPGKQKGILEVNLFFGKDFAACSLLEGQGPEPEDLLLIMKSQK
ncbi:Flagellar assembly protein T C-terminal domain-containing protein [Candidatus Magnetomoraceae bacterium gMMP-13]